MSRASHFKSRHGCARCKQRRVKCDEGAPCWNCIRRREECSLLPDDITSSSQSIISNSVYQASDASSAATHSASPPVGLPYDPCAPVARPSETWNQDLFLMSHFVSSTCQTFSIRQDVLHLWQTIIPEDAIPCRFLLHGILATSALHCASLRPSQRNKYERCFIQHESIAIPEYRRATHNIRTEYASPIFAMTYLSAILALASLSDNRLQKNNLNFDDLISLFTAIKVSHTVLVQDNVWKNITSSPYNVILVMHLVSGSESFILPANLQHRYQLLRGDCLDDLLVLRGSNDRRALEEAVNVLESLHRDVLFLISGMGPGKEIEIEPSLLLRWIGRVTPEFIQLFRQRHVAALVIFAGFSILFRFVGHRWFVKNWSVNVFALLRSIIDRRGLPWLDTLYGA